MENSLQPSSAIVDYPGLYRLSGLCDSLRDTAQVLLDQNTTQATVQDLAHQLHILRSEVAATLTPDAAESIDRFVPVVVEPLSVDRVFFAATQLSRLLDLLHTTPQFLLSQRVAAAQAVRIDSEVDAVLAGNDDGDSDTLEVPAASLQVGQYL